MKKKLLYGLAGLLVALLLVGFVACSDGDSGGGHSGGSDDDDGEIDVKNYEVSSTIPALLVSASKLSKATSVVIVFKYDTTDDCWLNVCSDTSWSNTIEIGWQEADTYTLTLTDSLCKVKNSDGDLVLTTTTYTLSTYASSGIYLAGGSTSGSGTVEIVSATVYYDDEETLDSDAATYVADEYGDETSAFSSVTVTYDSDYVITKVVVVLNDSDQTEKTISISDTWTDDGVTYYYSSFQTDDKIYYVYLYCSDGTWCYYYDYSSYTPHTASWGATTGDNALADYTVTMYADEDDVWYVEVTDGSTYYYPSTTTSSDTTTCSFTVAGENNTSTVYTLALTYDSDKDEYSYTYTYVAGYEATGTLGSTVLVTVDSSGITAVTVGGKSATATGENTVWTYGDYTLTFEGSDTSYTYSWSADLSATGALSWSMGYSVVVNATVTSAGEATINKVTVGSRSATVSESDNSVWTVTLYSVKYTLTFTVASGAATFTTATTPSYSGSSSDFTSLTVTYNE